MNTTTNRIVSKQIKIKIFEKQLNGEKITYESIGEQLGVSGAYISQILNGQRTGDSAIAKLYEIADLLEL